MQQRNYLSLPATCLSLPVAFPVKLKRWALLPKRPNLPASECSFLRRSRSSLSCGGSSSELCKRSSMLGEVRRSFPLSHSELLACQEQTPTNYGYNSRKTYSSSWGAVINVFRPPFSHSIFNQ